MTEQFIQKLEKYAEIAIKVGLNVQAGQRVHISAQVENYLFMQALVRQAYKAGARYVAPIYRDDTSERIRFEHAPADSFEEMPDWFIESRYSYGSQGDALLGVFDGDPYLYKPFNEDAVSTYQEAYAKAYDKVLQIIMGAETNRLTLGAPSKAWADLVLPEVPEEERMQAMWDLMFKLARINEEDPVKAWQAHVQQLKARCAFLNEKQYTAYHYKGPGTDLMVGMPENHFWGSAEMLSNNNITALVNIPTEEIFAAPHRARVNGVVASTLPLIDNGSLIDDFVLRFEEGKVVDAKAKVGQTFLDKILNADEGARRMGEIAIVPHSSPISQSGKLFYNTLFDENASCHFAVGGAYRQCIQGGKSMSQEAFMQAGGNVSKKHVDFMVGSAKLDIDGVLADGSREAVLKAGEWAFTL